jgi:hypothetical protein
MQATQPFRYSSNRRRKKKKKKKRDQSPESSLQLVLEKVHQRPDMWQNLDCKCISVLDGDFVRLDPGTHSSRSASYDDGAGA